MTQNECNQRDDRIHGRRNGNKGQVLRSHSLHPLNTSNLVLDCPSMSKFTFTEASRFVDRLPSDPSLHPPQDQNVYFV